MYAIFAIMHIQLSIVSSIIVCYNTSECIGTAFNTNQGVTGLGYNSVSGKSTSITVPSAMAFVSCEGAFSCYEISFIDSIGTVNCHGTHSCGNVSGSSSFIKVYSSGSLEYLSCLGSNSCQYSNLRATGNSKLYCSGDQSCAYSTIEQSYDITASGAYSLLYATIDSTGALGNVMDVNLEGYASGFGATITCQPSDTCNINCLTANACHMMYVNCMGVNGSNCNIGKYSNSSMEPIMDMNNFNDSAFHLLYNSNLLTKYNNEQCNQPMSTTYDIYYNAELQNVIIDTDICCRGSSSCTSANTIKINKSIDNIIVCSGKSTCSPDVTINNHMGPIFCEGYRACWRGNIITTNNVYCSGKQSCQEANISNVKNLFCSADRSCIDTTIRNASVIYFLGVSSGYNTNIYCNNSCLILCGSRYACQSSTVYCHTNCTILCEPEYLCPIIITTNPTVNPTNEPTIEPTTSDGIQTTNYTNIDGLKIIISFEYVAETNSTNDIVENLENITFSVLDRIISQQTLQNCSIEITLSSLDVYVNITHFTNFSFSNIETNIYYSCEQSITRNLILTIYDNLFDYFINNTHSSTYIIIHKTTFVVVTQIIVITETTSITNVSISTTERISSEFDWFYENLIFIIAGVTISAFCIFILILYCYCGNRKNQHINENVEPIVISNAMVILVAIGTYDRNPAASEIGDDYYLEDLQVGPDIQNLYKLFGPNHLNYTIYPHSNVQPPKLRWTQTEIVDLLKKRSKELNANIDNKFDGLIVVFSGHGMSDHIITSDYKLMAKNALHRMFTTYYKKSRELPRIHICDCCHGDYQHGKSKYQPDEIDEKDEIGKNFQMDDIKQSEEANDNAVIWAENTIHPDYRLVEINAADAGFQSRLNTVYGSYMIYEFVKKTIQDLTVSAHSENQKYIYQIFDEIELDLQNKGKQHIKTNYNDKTRYIKLKRNVNVMKGLETE
eukprot:545226_1